MAKSLKFSGIAGSIRSNSFSKALLYSVGTVLPSGSAIESIDIAALPHYNEDMEKGILPDSVLHARKIISDSDAVIIVTPEFNHGIPGVLKNTLDWLSRPAFDGVMVGKYVFFITQSPSPLGGVRAQYQLRETLSAMLCKLVPLPEIVIPGIHEKMTDGRFDDQRSIKYIEKQLSEFISYL